MTNVSDQANDAAQTGAVKAWAEPKLEKIEICETAAGIDPTTGLESVNPFYPAS